MKTTMLVKLFAVAVATTAIIAANSASAQQRMLISNPGPQPLLLQPGFQPEVPKLGFFGYTTFRGMVVTRVMPGTEASRIGLERGDMIISVNGFRIQREGDYERALLRSHGQVQLQVRDVRGRGVFLVRAFLDHPHDHHYYNHRPVVQYRSMSN